MEILYNLPSHFENSALALGFFDGVHLAHKKLIQKAVELAKKDNLKSAVITFLYPPSCIISGKTPVYISNMEDKIKIIEKEGVDYLFILDFKKLKHLGAKEYIDNILIKHFSPKYVITGFNHTFGAKRSGSAETLKKEKSFTYIEINPIEKEGLLVSSTNIKNIIKEGNIEKANKLLDRNFSIKGTVVKGNQIARELGYRTANIIWDENIIKPKYGVYKGYGTFNNKKYRALINFGIRPSIDKNLKETLEVHLIDFSEDIYDKELFVEFEDRIRGEIKFSSKNELIAQIKKDYNNVIVQNKINREQNAR